MEVQMAFLESFFAAFTAAFALVFLSEIGDKTQLALLAFSAEHPKQSKQIWMGASLAFLALSLAAVAVGRGVASFFPEFWIRVASSALFAAFGAHALLKKSKTETGGKKTAKEKQKLENAGHNAFWTAFGFIAVSEMGDKSQIVSLSLGATSAGLTGLAGVWAGAWLSMTVLAGLGVLVGRKAAENLPAKLLHQAAGVLFLLAAVLPWIFGTG